MPGRKLQDGYAVHMIPAQDECVDPGGTPDAVRKKITDIETGRINEAIQKITSDAYGAGFTVEVKSVTLQGCSWAILYRLDNDPSFRPPM